MFFDFLYFQTWDPELEMFSQRNLLQCDIEHDNCHNSLKYLFAGQNLATSCSSSPVSPEEALQTALSGWWNENTRITAINANNVYNSIQANGDFGHYAQMAHGNSFKVGCAAITTQNGNCYFIACDYAMGNFETDPIYAVGATRSGCQTQSATYPGLCGTDNNYYGDQSDGVALFNNDQTVPNAVTVFINNGRVLFGSAATTTSAATTSSTSSNVATTSGYISN